MAKEKRNCKFCNELFVLNRKDKVFCNENCKRKYKYWNGAETGHSISCRVCGFTFSSMRSDKLYCSIKCRKGAEYIRNKGTINKKGKEYRLKNKEKISLQRKEKYEQWKEIENKRREDLGLPLIGQGFLREMEMICYLKRLFPDCQLNERDRKTLGGLELDAYLPELNIAFEYMGRQHFEECVVNNRTIYVQTKEELEALQFRDNKKKGLCKQLGIVLIHINYKEKLSEQLILSKLKKYDNQSIQEVIKI